MKKILIIGFLCIVFEFACQGQRMYSLENLRQSSPESLSTYLMLAKKQRKTGTILTVAGSATAIAGFVVFAATWDDDAFIGYTTGSDVGGLMILLGTGATAVGVPILITGSSRIKRINKIMNNFGEVFLELAPCCFKDLVAQNNQTGITLRLRF